MQDHSESTSLFSSLLNVAEDIGGAEQIFNDLKDEICKKNYDSAFVQSKLQKLTNYRSISTDVDFYLSELLIQATKSGHSLVIKELLKYGVKQTYKASFRDKDGNKAAGTAVHIAISNQSRECLQELIANLKTADLKNLQTNGKTLGQFSFEQNSLAITKILYEKFGYELFTEKNNTHKNTLTTVIDKIVKTKKIDFNQKYILKIVIDNNDLEKYVNCKNDNELANKIKELIAKQLSERTIPQKNYSTESIPSSHKSKKRKANNKPGNSNNNNNLENSSSSNNSSDEVPLAEASKNKRQRNDKQSKNKSTTTKTKKGKSLSTLTDEIMAQHPNITEILTEEHFKMCDYWPQSDLKKYIAQGYYTLLLVFHPPEEKNDQEKKSWQSNMLHFLKACNTKNILLFSQKDDTEKNKITVRDETYAIIDPINQQKSDITYTPFDIVVYHNATYRIASILREIKQRLELGHAVIQNEILINNTNTVVSEAPTTMKVVSATPDPMVSGSSDSEDTSTPTSSQSESEPNPDSMQIDTSSLSAIIPTVIIPETLHASTEQEAVATMMNTEPLDTEEPKDAPSSQTLNFLSTSIEQTGNTLQSSKVIVDSANSDSADSDDEFSYISDLEKREEYRQQAKKLDEQIAQELAAKQQEENKRAALAEEVKAQQAKLQQEQQRKRDLQRKRAEQQMKARQATLAKITQEKSQTAKEVEEKEKVVLELKEKTLKVGESINKLMQQVSASTQSRENLEKDKTLSILPNQGSDKST